MFNESIEFYEKKTIEWWVRYDSSHIKDVFSKKEEDEIRNILKKYWKIKIKDKFASIANIEFIRYENNYNECGSITKYEDDWYIVGYEYSDISRRGDIWLCDGLAGIKKVFEDETLM